MTVKIDIDSLSRTEKFQIMEAIWDNLIHDKIAIESPDWHKEELNKTEKKLSLGEELKVDWEEAKNQLRNKFK